MMPCTLTLVFMTGLLTVSLFFISAILMLAREPILSGLSCGLTSRLFPRRAEKLVELLPWKDKKIMKLTPAHKQWCQVFSSLLGKASSLHVTLQRIKIFSSYENVSSRGSDFYLHMRASLDLWTRDCADTSSLSWCGHGRCGGSRCHWSPPDPASPGGSRAPRLGGQTPAPGTCTCNTITYVAWDKC